MAITVRRYKGERRLARGLSAMQAEGWSVESHNTRKAWWSWVTGVFTRKQVHTVTFSREASR